MRRMEKERTTLYLYDRFWSYTFTTDLKVVGRTWSSTDPTSGTSVFFRPESPETPSFGGVFRIDVGDLKRNTPPPPYTKKTFGAQSQSRLGLTTSILASKCPLLQLRISLYLTCQLFNTSCLKSLKFHTKEKETFLEPEDGEVKYLL